MTELERRALLGDRQAQEECTRQGILLPCPLCGEQAGVKTKKSEYGLSGTIIRCNKCGLRLYSPDAKAKSISGGIRNVAIENHREIGFSRWNTRPAPPVGHCGECGHLKDDGACLCCEVFNMTTPGPEAFCCRFEPKGSEENGRTAAD